MLLLAIDTAGPDCSVALAKSGSAGTAILFERSERIGRGHAERLMPMIESSLDAAGVAFDDLQRIAVTTGPGSFTGVRVGIAAARGLALALDIPAIGIGSLDALALPVMRERKQGTVVATLDARRGEVYALARDLATGETLIDSSAIAVEAIATKLATAQRPFVLNGSGATLLAAACGDGCIIAGTADSPAIAHVASLGAKDVPSDAPIPLYARGADAKPQGDKAVARR
jgi:tRNA threonylcarbamoyl adenosine modification protein YeaZ